MPSTDPGQLWQMPAYEGYEPVDLADPSVVIGPPQAHAQNQSQNQARIQATVAR
jgi:hypothetical protein